MPMQATSTARRTPPAPAALNCVDVVPCIRGENSSVEGAREPVLCDTPIPHEKPTSPLARSRFRRQRGPDLERPETARRALRDRGAEQARVPAGTGRRTCRLRGRGRLARAVPRAWHAPRRALVRRRVLALSGGSPTRAAPVADRDRAAGVRDRARHSRGGRVHGADRGALEERPTRSGGVPARLPRASSAPPPRPATSRPSSCRVRGR